MGIYWALKRGYKGIITIDGNNKDSIEDVPHFIDKLKEGYTLVQGSRFIDGGRAINTPHVRALAVRLVHAPIFPWLPNSALQTRQMPSEPIPQSI